MTKPIVPALLPAVWGTSLSCLPFQAAGSRLGFAVQFNESDGWGRMGWEGWFIPMAARSSIRNASAASRSWIDTAQERSDRKLDTGGDSLSSAVEVHGRDRRYV